MATASGRRHRPRRRPLPPSIEDDSACGRTRFLLPAAPPSDSHRFRAFAPILLLLAASAAAAGADSATGAFIVPPRRWSVPSPTAKAGGRHAAFSIFAASDGDREGSDEGDNEGGEDDWRDFRARLVAQERDGLSSSSLSSDDGGSDGNDRTAVKKQPSGVGWAYDSGDVVERGSVVLARPEQDFGYGLRQQYFHKSVVLILDHDPSSFTRGIILNRPTDLVLGDEDMAYDDGAPLEDADDGNEWRVWFGGDVCGLYDDEEAEVVCLHSIGGDLAREISDEVIKGVYWTTLAGARKLMREGGAKTEDFWVFCGYAVRVVPFPPWVVREGLYLKWQNNGS